MPKDLIEEKKKCYTKWIKTLSKDNLVDLVLRLNKELEYEKLGNCNLREGMRSSLALNDFHHNQRPWETPASHVPGSFILKGKKGVYP